MTIKPIGVIETNFEEKSGVPIQSVFGKEHEGVITIFPEYADGLNDLSAISHIYLIYHFNRHHDYSMMVTPYMDDTPRGLFATRAPKRPSGIGMSVVEIIRVEKNKIFFKGVDMLNNTPLLDIKPYVPEIDCFPMAKSGWYENIKNKNKNKVSDDRF
ncbi:MAG: tRNA (N6-threonylcarbamoyladenosine(37)-N6)-methyltransferase TrmO [Oligoflexia bacterium]|nr:tRNA (N6-threonylcarbamoyladenosine(37)-N6)-methyltransferase TrmO [Oligoflexia bacterium]